MSNQSPVGRLMKPTVTVSVDQVEVRRGQTLTVWLARHTGEQGQYERYQVELRVRPDGTPEIYHDEEIVSEYFDDWKPMEVER